LRVLGKGRGALGWAKGGAKGVGVVRRRLVGCQDAQKMIVFLRYLFNEANLRSYCRDEWIKLYDKEFVDGVIEGALGWMAGGLEALMVELERKVYLTAERKAEVFEVQLAGRKTVAAPFNLSEPRPKPLPMEEPPPPRPTGKPPPPQKEVLSPCPLNSRSESLVALDRCAF
jgi:hypothetical protein